MSEYIQSEHAKKGFKGYFTVEAAMIMPSVLLLTAFLFYLGFFLYNRCILTQDAYILAFRGSMLCSDPEGTVRDYIQQNSKKQLGGQYIGLHRMEQNLHITKKKVEIELRGRMNIMGREVEFFSAKEAQRNCPVQNIRRIRQIKKHMENIRKGDS